MTPNLHYICDDDFTNIRPVDLMTWARWFEGHHTRESRRRVAFTETQRGRVSTVFLGLDHRYDDEEGPPILFETMIFAGGWDCDDDQERATNVDDARRIHEKFVARLAAAKKVLGNGY